MEKLLELTNNIAQLSGKMPEIVILTALEIKKSRLVRIIREHLELIIDQFINYKMVQNRNDFLKECQKIAERYNIGEYASILQNIKSFDKDSFESISLLLFNLMENLTEQEIKELVIYQTGVYKSLSDQSDPLGKDHKLKMCLNPEILESIIELSILDNREKITWLDKWRRDNSDKCKKLEFELTKEQNNEKLQRELDSRNKLVSLIYNVNI